MVSTFDASTSKAWAAPPKGVGAQKKNTQIASKKLIIEKEKNLTLKIHAHAASAIAI